MPEKRNKDFNRDLQYWISQLHNFCHILKTVVVYSSRIVQIDAELLSFLPLTLRFVQNGWLAAAVFASIVLFRGMRLQQTQKRMKENKEKLENYLNSKTKATIQDQHTHQETLWLFIEDVIMQKTVIGLSFLSIYYISTFEFIITLSRFTPQTWHVILTSYACVGMFSFFFAFHITIGQIKLLDTQQRIAATLSDLIQTKQLTIEQHVQSRYFWRYALGTLITCAALTALLTYPMYSAPFWVSVTCLIALSSCSIYHFYTQYAPQVLSLVYSLSVGISSLLSISNIVHLHPGLLYFAGTAYMQALPVEIFIITTHTILSVLYAACTYSIQRQNLATRAFIEQLPICKDIHLNENPNCPQTPSTGLALIQSPKTLATLIGKYNTVDTPKVKQT